MTDELGGKIMTEFVALKPKTYYYLMMTEKLKRQKEEKNV